MGIFNKSQENQVKFNELINKIDDINSKLEKYNSNDIDMSSIRKIKQNFITKTDDFFREDRKLNIGVIGQVKAGKSSFLNTLIFDGMEILPKASTPKTATLTKIEYSSENSIVIEYYTMEEWKSLEEKVLVDSELNEYAVAKEIINMVKKNGITPHNYLTKGTESIKFASYVDLMNELNTYVGEDGKITPLVKSVKLNINNEYLKEISVVDTPGLNDPIASRTDKTKQFIEMCDVVFFLSKASGFIDKSDVDLLTAQLPQKGVKRLVLICSRYDDGLADTIYDKGGLSEADVDTKHRLKKHAIKTFDKIIDGYTKRNVSREFLSIIKECKSPIFVSSMTHNMSRKSKEDYNSQEMQAYENLNVYDEVDNNALERIGNMEEVRKIFNEVILQKEETLEKKSSSFIPNTLQEIKNELGTLKQTVEKRVNLLLNNDREQLINEKKYIATQINSISANIENVFGELNIKLEQSKVEALRNLREGSKEYSNLSERMGTETHYESHNVSTAKWYNPFSWGTSRTEQSSYDERYYYLDVSDALENIRNYANDATNSIEHMFYKSVDIASLKRKLLNVIIENFDASDENYDPAYFKLLAEKTLSDISLPVIKIDISEFLNSVAGKFSGEIKNSSEKSNLKSMLASAISHLFDEIIGKFVDELTSFKSELEPIKNGFAEKLLVNINSEFNIVLQQFENKEYEIQMGKEFITEINTLIKELD
ncbi:dynamin family protein [Clostridium sp.]|uniref:dynamin family protein n=1 Tax=Clostridium sp. TaxID=1506 RepID=UPI003D6D6028